MSEQKLEEKECVPCKERAVVGIATEICQDAETQNLIEAGQCKVIRKDYDDEKITLPEVIKKMEDALPEAHKQAIMVLKDMARSKNIKVDVEEDHEPKPM